MARALYPWERFYPNNLRWELPRVLGRVDKLLAVSARTFGERIALDFMGRTTTYTELDAAVTAFASGLQERGISRGDRVALCLPNTPFAVIAYYGILRAGGIVVNLNPLLTTDELTNLLADSGARTVVTVDLKLIYDKLLHVPTLEHIIVADFAQALPYVKSFMFRLIKHAERAKPEFGKKIIAFSNIIACRKPLNRVRVHAKDIALLQYTGGTTGIPKSAALTHGNLLSNTEQIRLWLGPVSPDGERFVVVLPLFHVFAMTVCMNLPLTLGATMVLLPRFDMREFLATLARVRATILPGVPTLFGALANAPHARKALQNLRWCICGGAPLPAEVKHRFESLSGSALVEGYGLTEASPVVCCNPNHIPPRAGSVGLPLPGTEVQIRHTIETDRVLGVGETGEIYVRGPQIMAGYWGRTQETRNVLQKGWLRTGDVGKIDADGFVYVTDRIKDIIISNGYNVYARVVEEAFYRHPDVAEVTVIAIPHTHKGEVAKAFVVLKPSASATRDDLMTFVRRHLNPLERPAEIELRDYLPKTAAGKLSKKELVAEEQRKREKR